MKNKTLLLVVALVAVTAIGAATYFYFDNKSKERKLAEAEKDHSLVDNMQLDEVIDLLVKKGIDISKLDISPNNELFLKTMLKGALNNLK